jgi:hypothetical protein
VPKLPAETEKHPPQNFPGGSFTNIQKIQSGELTQLISREDSLGPNAQGLSVSAL